MDFERRRRHVHEINLTALIDIVFHLMVFVMLTTTFIVSESMELSLPSARAGQAAEAATTVTRIEIIGGDLVKLDAEPMNLGRMNVILAERIAANPEARIAIFTTPGVSVQQLVNVMDSVYLTGGRNVQVDKAV